MIDCQLAAVYYSLRYCNVGDVCGFARVCIVLDPNSITGVIKMSLFLFVGSICHLDCWAKLIYFISNLKSCKKGVNELE